MLDHRVLKLHEIGNGAAIDREDLVARLDASDRGGRIDERLVVQLQLGRHAANAGGCLVGGHGPTDGPQDRREQKGEDDIEERTRGKNDHSSAIGDRRELGGVHAGLALDPAHVGQLRERDVAAQRQPRDAVLDAVLAFPGKNLRPEADGEPTHMHAPATSSEEVAQLMDENGAAEKQDDQEDGPDIT